MFLEPKWQSFEEWKWEGKQTEDAASHILNSDACIIMGVIPLKQCRDHNIITRTARIIAVV